MDGAGNAGSVPAEHQADANSAADADRMAVEAPEAHAATVVASDAAAATTAEMSEKQQEFKGRVHRYVWESMLPMPRACAHCSDSLARSLGQVLLPTHQGLRPCRVREPALRQQSRYVATRSPYGVLLFRIDLTRDTRQSSCPSSPTTPPASACASQ